MTNNQRKIANAKVHNEKRRLSLVRKANNDFARDNFSISLSYFIRVTLGNSNPKNVRKDMQNYERLPVPEGMTDEIISDCIEFLTTESNNKGENMVWSESVKLLKQAKELTGQQATYAFVRWTHYKDNRKTLSKVVNFD